MSGNNREKNQDYVARGLKATIHNDNTSDQAKESAAERLEQMGAEVPADYANKIDKQEYSGGDDGSTEGNGGGLSRQSIAGYKSALARDNVSEEKKEHAREVLEEAGAL